MFDSLAKTDFTRARRKAFWQQVRNNLTGRSNALLPFDSVREAIPMKGQHYRGLQSIPIRQIVGSMGRYHEFNRAFLPLQEHTQDRWVKVGQAHYQAVNLPPIEVYQVGEVYFVKDGNHRVSVGRARDQAFIDAYVTEIDIPVRLTRDTEMADLEAKRESALFLEKTGLLGMFPDAEIEVSLPGESTRLLEHIDTHRYYLGTRAGEDPPYEHAVRSWYENVYLPLVNVIEKQGLAKQFGSLTTTDLYLVVSAYQWLLRGAGDGKASNEETRLAFQNTLKQLAPGDDLPARRLSRSLHNAPWLDDYILRAEKDEFTGRTGLHLEATVPGAYSTLLQHIEDHRWFAGIDQKHEVSWEEAVLGWFEDVYSPIRVLIETLDVMDHFDGRTPTDLYLWIIRHQANLTKSLDWDITPETAVQDLIDKTGERDHAGENAFSPLYRDILVPVGDNPEDMVALEQALGVAERNMGRVFGLHVISKHDKSGEEEHKAFAEDFAARCAARNVPGRVAFEEGAVARKIAERAAWADLIVLNLKHPPGVSGFAKLASGFRTILRRSGRPVLAVPDRPSGLKSILLAYDGSPLADRAMWTAARMMLFWEDTQLTVLTASKKGIKNSRKVLDRARAFLASHHVEADYRCEDEAPRKAILDTQKDANSDLILMGGYGDSPLVELTFGSTLDGILQDSTVPILIVN